MVAIKSFLPNPVGSDNLLEEITLINTSENIVSLSGFSVADASGRSFYLSGSLGAGEELVLLSSETKIRLNNNGETVYLYDASGSAVDTLSFAGSATEGVPVTNAAHLSFEEVSYLFEQRAVFADDFVAGAYQLVSPAASALFSSLLFAGFVVSVLAALTSFTFNKVLARV